MKTGILFRIISCLISLILLFPTELTARAQSVDISKVIDTLSISQEGYLAEIHELENQYSGININREENIIEKTCEAFLAISKASVRLPEKYNQTVLILLSSMGLNTVKYRLSEYQYQTNLNRLLKTVITNDEIEFTNFTVSLYGNTAKASIVETYTYYMNDGFDGFNFRRRLYIFDLKKTDGKWMIADVITDDPWESSGNFDYEPMDLNNSLQELSEQLDSVKLYIEPPIAEKLDDPILLSLNRWTYKVSDAVDYAVAHYSETSNSVFGFTTDNNCQNFASQCVWAGLGGSGTSTTARPAVPTSLVGSNAFNVWARNQATTFYPPDNYYYNWAWDNVNGFAKLMSASKTTAEGPFGTSYYINALANAAAGNVISFNQDGAASSGNLDHAMFVTAVTGTAGSRTKANIKIAAHTSATNSAYQVLSTYTSLPAANFARSIIWGGYYSILQP
jgi:hypothetical protein